MLTIFEFKDIKKPLGKFKIHQLPNGKFYAHTKFSWLGRKFFISRMDFGVLYNHYCLRDYEIIEYDHHFNLVLFDTKESLIEAIDKFFIKFEESEGEFLNLRDTKKVLSSWF